MALQGNIDSFSVVDVLRLLGSSAKSGRLVVDGDRGSGSLWLVEGLVVAGTTTRTGSSVLTAPPSDVLFDLLRFSEGSFVFEAGAEQIDPTRHDAGPAVEIEPMISEAEEALVEWDDIVAVVPSLRSSVSLVLDLADESVVVDRRCWSGVVAVAEGVAASGDGTTVGVVAEMTGLSELPALRLVRDLVVAGLVEVGAETTDEHRFAPGFNGATFEVPLPDAFTAPFTPFDEPEAPAPPVSASFEPAGLDGLAFDAPAPTLSTEPPAPAFAPPAYEPADVDLPPPHGAPAEVPQPIGNLGSPLSSGVDSPAESFAPFAPFDPFGTAESSESAESAEFAGDRSGEGDARVADRDVVDGDPVSEADQAAQQAEFARQLAMLSPRAAEAVASAEAGPSTEDEERARVARFLGSV